MQWFDGDTAEWVGKALPGAVGSLIALAWMKAPWPRKVVMWASGAALSYFAASSAATWANTNEGLAGFLLGLFGMAVVDKVFKTWESFDATALLGEALRKLLRLGPAKNDDQQQ